MDDKVYESLLGMVYAGDFLRLRCRMAKDNEIATDSDAQELVKAAI